MIPRQPLAGNPGQRYWRRRANRKVRKARLTRSLLRWSVIVLLDLLIAGGFLWAAIRIVGRVSTAGEFVLARIEIEGAERASVPGIQKLLSPYIGGNLFELDLRQIVARAAQDPWTQDVSAKRILPGTIRVKITERVPCARAAFGDQAWVVDTLGYVVGRAGEESAELPLLTGLDGRSPASLIGSLSAGARAVRRLQEEAGSWLHEIAELDLSHKDRIAVRTVDPGPVILLDRHRVTRNLEPYLELRHEISHRYGELDYVDLRWQDRISVKQKESERQVSNG